ncbi:hypothetical protein R50345_03320 [Paenibacillus sp. FSL R5-0345]|nr:hypothetical protein R50345_03320 [Paenibacillus sp. FSL R5-0345]
MDGKKERKKERKKKRKKDRQAGRQAGRQTDRQTGRLSSSSARLFLLQEEKGINPVDNMGIGEIASKERKEVHKYT